MSTTPTNERDVDPSASEPTHVILACDESGAKGYADVNDIASDDIGVFAGIMVPASELRMVQPDFDALAKKYAAADGKLHITDLSKEMQEALRLGVYELVRKHRLPLFYEAIHVAGFSFIYKTMLEAVQAGRQEQNSPIKISANLPPAPSLHVELFSGLYSKVVAFCMERDERRLHIEVRTDRVDSPIVREFAAATKKLMDYGPAVKDVKGFDIRTKEVVHGSITVGPVATQLQDIEITKFELNVRDDSDGLVVAADVLVNSLHYLFKHRPAKEKYRALNTRSAFAAHPLFAHLDTFFDWGSYSHPDTFYRHPSDPALSEPEE